tara:strand:+ start:1551 stop:1700 length:150 start_codon:yes stop_codon:yes gene_type:complete
MKEPFLPARKSLPLTTDEDRKMFEEWVKRKEQEQQEKEKDNDHVVIVDI